MLQTNGNNVRNLTKEKDHSKNHYADLVPWSLDHFRANFTYDQVEEENGFCSATDEHNGVMGLIVLEANVDIGVLRGKRHHLLHPKYNVLLCGDKNGTKKGYVFSVTCLNRHPGFKGAVFFKRYISAKDMVALLANKGEPNQLGEFVISFPGHNLNAPGEDDTLEAILTIAPALGAGSVNMFSIQNVSIYVSTAFYRRFVEYKVY